MTETRLPPDSEEELRKVLGGRIEQEAAGAPAFARLLARSAAGARYGRLPVGPLAVAVAAAVGVLLFWAAHTVRRPRVPREQASRSMRLERWKAPTDVLLETPGATLLVSTPVLSEPAPDYSRLEQGSVPRGRS